MTRSRPRLQIIRGLPGSGKTTLALKRYPHLLRLETDMFFYSKGEYRFSMKRNEMAVEWFLSEVDLLCSCKVDFVATGVFAAHTERIRETIAIALDYGYDVYVKTLTTQYKGIHGVPKVHFDAMKSSFVPEEDLINVYKHNTRVHFGLMDKGMELAHLKNQKKGKRN